MRSLSFVVLSSIALAAVLTACGGGKSEPTPAAATSTPGTPTTAATNPASTATSATASATPSSPTASPAATPTVVGPSGNEDISDAGYRAFLAKLDAALRTKQTAFVTERFAAEPYTCKAEDVPQQLGGPLCTSVGQQFNAFPSSNWRSEGSYIPVESAANHFANVTASVLPDARDQFGEGTLRLFATGASGRTVVTGIRPCPANASCPGGNNRFVLVFHWRFIGARWVADSMLTAGVLAEDFLTPTQEGRNALGGQWLAYGNQPDLSPAIRGAIQAALRVFTEAKGAPDCVKGTPCIEAFDPGGSIDEGVIRLSYSAEVGAAAIYLARDQSGAWQFWFGAQQATHRLTDLPGTLIVCADGDGLNLRSGPNAGAPTLGLAKDGERFFAKTFLITEFGDVNLKAGAGWYQVVTETKDAQGRIKTGEAFIFSRFTSDARLRDCTLRNALER
ncbi:MAG: hypothetical protein ACKVVT_16595 [Dehalococcoidia bacterium]